MTQMTETIAAGDEEELVQEILANLTTIQTTMGGLSRLNPENEGGFDSGQILTALTEGLTNVPADLEALSEKFLNLSTIQLEEGQVLTEQLLKDQLTPEKFDAMMPVLEQRFVYALQKENMNLSMRLSEENQKLLTYMSDFSKTQEDRTAVGRLSASIGTNLFRSEGQQTEDRFDYYNSIGASPGQIEGMENMRTLMEPLKTTPQNDFIQRPGQSPIGFNENDIIIGGTNLLSTGGGNTGGGNTSGDDSHLIMLLERLITVVQNGTTIQLDGNKLGQGLVLGSSRIGTTVR
jgi:hypothetical protein